MLKKCTPLWREAHLEVKSVKTRQVRSYFWKLRCGKSARRCGAKHIWKSKVYKTRGSRTTFGSWDVEKVHAVVARSTFWSKNAQITACSGHFWTLRCRKSARRCGAKHISKSKVSKHLVFGPLFDDPMAIRCRKSARSCGSCGAKHISKSKVSKTEGFWATFWWFQLQQLQLQQPQLQQPQLATTTATRTTTTTTRNTTLQ